MLKRDKPNNKYSITLVDWSAPVWKHCSSSADVNRTLCGVFVSEDRTHNTLGTWFQIQLSPSFLG